MPGSTLKAGPVGMRGPRSCLVLEQVGPPGLPGLSAIGSPGPRLSWDQVLVNVCRDAPQACAPNTFLSRSEMTQTPGPQRLRRGTGAAAPSAIVGQAYSPSRQVREPLWTHGSYSN